MNWNMTEINDKTGFANGDKFASETQVRAYFTRRSMVDMFGPDYQYTRNDLDTMADIVIANRWHCDF